MAYTYEGTPVLSKIKIGNSEYYLKDADVRAILDTFNNTIVTGTLGTVADNNGNLVTAQNIKSYVDSAVGVGLVVEVVQTLPTASASTTGKLYLVADQGGDTGDNYNEYITVRSGAGTELDPYEYAWEKIGDTSIDLSGYLTNVAYVTNTHTLQQTKGGQTTDVHTFGDMADADTASTTLTDYVTGVTSAKTTAAGTIVKDAGTSGTQIEGTVSSITVIDGVGSAPSLTTATKALYKQGIKCEMGTGADSETLIFSNVAKEADINVITSWSAGSAPTTKNVTPTFTGAYYNFTGSEVNTTITLTKENKTIQVSPDAQVNPPNKGDLINIDMTGSGTPQQYRVLKVNGNIAEVLSMSNATSTAFNSDNTNPYEGKTLDTYLNITWYNTLSSTAKAAIVGKTFNQDSWYFGTSGNPDYEGKYIGDGDTPYEVSLGNASYGNEITRHVYAISVQDVLDYLEVTPQMTQANTTLTYDNVWTMFWNSTTTHSGNIWLRSASSSASRAFGVFGYDGYLNTSHAKNSYAVRPAFQIDLSKIEWTPTT